MWKNRLFYAVCLIASLVFVYFNGGTVPYLLAELFLAAPAVSLVYLLLCWFALRRGPKSEACYAVKGDTAKFSFGLKNRGLLPLPLVRLRFRFENKAFSGVEKAYAFSLAPFETGSCSVAAHCLLAGCFPCGVQSLELRDFLGIFRLKKRAGELFPVCVLPRLLNPGRLPFEGETGFNAAAARFRYATDPLTVADIRQYVDGDSFRDVHWNLSAKKGELMVKTHDPSANAPALLLVDFSPCPAGTEPLSYLDRLLEFTATLAHYCLKEGLPLRVAFYAGGQRREYELAGPDDFAPFYRLLPTLRADAAVPAPALIEEFLQGPPQAQNLLLVTGLPGGAVAETLLKAQRSGYETFLYNAALPVPEEGEAAWEAEGRTGGPREAEVKRA